MATMRKECGSAGAARSRTLVGYHVGKGKGFVYQKAILNLRGSCMALVSLETLRLGLG